MRKVNFRELIAEHPEVLTDRRSLSCLRDGSAAEASRKLNDHGVIMLRDVLPKDTLAESHRTFRRFVAELGKKKDAAPREDDRELALDDGPSPKWDGGEDKSGSWHAPWAVRHAGHSPTAAIMAALVKSWAWPVIEEICHSQDIAVMFGLCLARHRIDEQLGVGVHQDAKVVNPEIPLSIWIPLSEVAPNRHSGLGFVVPNPGEILPMLDDSEAGAEYVLDNLDRVWVPHYHAGDLTIHSRYSPHFTTGYGTHSHRYSLEIRLWAFEESFTPYYDPSVRIRRRNGVPVIVEARCSLGTGAHGFLANVSQLTMEAVSSPARKRGLGRSFMEALRGVGR